MKSSAKKVELASVDDLFSTEESRLEERLEKIQEIPLSELHPFKNHPFKVKDDEAMLETADSIKQYGFAGQPDTRPRSKTAAFPLRGCRKLCWDAGRKTQSSSGCYPKISLRRESCVLSAHGLKYPS